MVLRQIIAIQQIAVPGVPDRHPQTAAIFALTEEQLVVLQRRPGSKGVVPGLTELQMSPESFPPKGGVNSFRTAAGAFHIG